MMSNVPKGIKEVEVVVARRRSVFINDPIDTTTGKPSGPGKFHGPGSKIRVGENEIERLFKQGFILDPFKKPELALSKEQIEQASVSDYVPSSEPGEAEVTVSEEAEQSVKSGKRGRG